MLLTDGRTYRRTDGQTDGQTDGRHTIIRPKFHFGRIEMEKNVPLAGQTPYMICDHSISNGLVF